MSVTIVDKPRDFSLSRAKLIYSCTSTNTAQANFKFVVTVLRDATQLCKFYIDPNPADSLIFDLSEAIRGELSIDVEDSRGDIVHNMPHNFFEAQTVATNGADVFTVNFAEYYGTTPTEQTTSATHTLQVQNGITKINEGLHVDLFDYGADNITRKAFLTDVERIDGANITLYASDNDYGTLSFVNADSTYLSATQRNIVYGIYDDDGDYSNPLGSATIAINSSNGSEVPTSATGNEKLVHFGAFPANVNNGNHPVLNAKPSQFPNWKYIRYFFTNNSGSRCSAYLIIKRRYDSCKHTPVRLAWENSLGGWDYFTMDGRKKPSVSVERKSYRQSIGNYSAATYSLNTWDRGKTNYHVETSELYEVNSGKINTYDSDLLKNCLTSRTVMAYIESQWLPVTIENNTVRYETEPISKLQEITFNITIAQKPC